MAGPDPPEAVLVLLDAELAEGPLGGAALLKPPHGYELVWADEAARPERRLCFWRPLPYEGSVLFTRLWDSQRDGRTVCSVGIVGVLRWRPGAPNGGWLVQACQGSPFMCRPTEAS